MKRAVSDKAIDFSNLLCKIGNVHSDLGGNYSKAKQYFEELVELQKDILGKKHIELAKTFNSITKIYLLEDNFMDALDFSDKALEIAEAHDEESDVLVLADIVSNKGMIHERVGKIDEAMLFYRQALKMKASIFGAEDPKIADSLNNIANLYYEKGRYDEASKVYNQALEMKEKCLGPKDP